MKPCNKSKTLKQIFHEAFFKNKGVTSEHFYQKISDKYGDRSFQCL